MYNKPNKPSNNMKMLSKKLSWLLRHGALEPWRHGEGLHIEADGFVKVDDILKHHNYARHYTLAILQELVEKDEKQRYQLRKSPQTVNWEIRANQGHTLKEVADEKCLKLIQTAEEVPLAVHGTYFRNWTAIKEQGLKRMSRNHIHFATSDSKPNNISGFRSDCQVLIYLNVKRIFEEGQLKLYRSDNNVILCSGLEDGTIPNKYFDKVIDRRTGQLLEF